MASSRYILGLRHKFIVVTAGDYLVTSLVWSDLDATTDQLVDAQSGDVIKVSISALTGSEASDLCLNVATMVSGAIVNRVGSYGPNDVGISGWFAPASTITPLGATKRYVVQNGDVANGQIQLRLRTRINAGATPVGRTLHASAGTPLEFAVENLGKPQGH